MPRWSVPLLSGFPLPPTYPDHLAWAVNVWVWRLETPGGQDLGGMIWENGIRTCIISYKKRIASPGSIQDAWSRCTGMTQRDGMGNPSGQAHPGGSQGPTANAACLTSWPWDPGPVQRVSTPVPASSFAPAVCRWPLAPSAAWCRMLQNGSPALQLWWPSL